MTRAELAHLVTYINERLAELTPLLKAKQKALRNHIARAHATGEFLPLPQFEKLTHELAALQEERDGLAQQNHAIAFRKHKGHDLNYFIARVAYERFGRDAFRAIESEARQLRDAEDIEVDWTIKPESQDNTWFFELVNTVYQRDNEQCRRCHRHLNKPRVHHLSGKRNTADNLVTMCFECERWIHSEQNIKKEFLG